MVPSALVSHVLASCGVVCCVALSNPDSAVKMICVMSVDDVSFAITALNVLGEVVWAITKRPP